MSTGIFPGELGRSSFGDIRPGMKIGEKIKAYRLTTGLSQEAFADEIGVTQGAVSKWETGEKIPSDADNVAALSDHSGYNYRYFMEDGPSWSEISSAGFAERGIQRLSKKLSRAETAVEIVRLIVEQRGGDRKVTENQMLEIRRTVSHLISGKLLP